MPLVGLDELVPFTGRAVEPRETRERLHVAWIDLEHLLESLRGQLGLDELFPHRREAHEEEISLALRGHHLELHLEDLAKIRPALGLGVEPLEALERREVRRIDSMTSL